MPFYAYKCNCGHDFEMLLKISESGVTQSCPKCGGSETHKVVSRTHVIFKGDGWHDKDLRINKQMALKNLKLSARENDRKHDAPVASLVPNVDGERVSSWSDAKKLAQSKGKDGASYDKMIRKEISA